MEQISQYNGKEYKFLKEKRKHYRVNFNLEIFYPHINGKKDAANSEAEGAVLTAINISESGIGFKSKTSLKKGDFIDFLLSIKGNASFHVIAEVKWCAYDDDFYLVGCEFFCLTLDQLKIIRKHVESKSMKCVS